MTMPINLILLSFFWFKLEEMDIYSFTFDVSAVNIIYLVLNSQLVDVI